MYITVQIVKPYVSASCKIMTYVITTFMCSTLELEYEITPSVAECDMYDIIG